MAGGSTLRAALISVLFITLLGAPPIASATHWTLYYAGLDDSVGATNEDDGAVINAPGNPLHGRANRVVYPGRTPGDGGRFLDARMGTDVGTYTYPGAVWPDGSGRERVLPGLQGLSAWFGTWNDLNGDSIIDDVHDGNCAGEPCANDEFIWRGIGSGVHDATMVAYQIPGTGSTSISLSRLIVPGGLLSVYGFREHYVYGEFADRTSRENAEQGWIGPSRLASDQGFLVQAEVLVLAGAQAAPASGLNYDINDPSALYDVDVYDVVNSDVTALYANVPALHYALTEPIVPIASAIGNATPGVPLGPTVTLILEAADVLNDVQDDLQDPDSPLGELATNPGTAVRRRYMSPDAKEPNTELDDYGLRAFFGGVGDIAGSMNAYPGYEDGYHLYFDNVPRFGVCAGGYARVPTTTIQISGAGSCQHSMKFDSVQPPNADPLGANFAEARTAPASLLFHGYLFLWKDANRDTHVGNICDPDDGETFDAERNTCKRPPYPWPHDAYAEQYDVCDSARAKGRSFTVTPLDGDWTGVILARNIQETTRVAFDPETWVVLEGSDPVTLRWQDACKSVFGYATGVYARDELIFLSGGNRMPLAVRAEVSLAGFKEVDLGIDVGEEYVIDYDVLPAAL